MMSMAATTTNAKSALSEPRDIETKARDKENVGSRYQRTLPVDSRSMRDGAFKRFNNKERWNSREERKHYMHPFAGAEQVCVSLI
jgi:hypothetical protein